MFILTVFTLKKVLEPEKETVVFLGKLGLGNKIKNIFRRENNPIGMNEVSV